MNNYDNFPLEKTLLNEIEFACKVLLIPSGQTIIKLGDRIDYIPLIFKGSVRVYEKDPKDGREILLYYVKENEPCLFSYFTIYEDSISDCYGTTQKDCILLMIPKNLMISWQLKYFSWHKYICNTYLKKYHLLIDAIKHNSFSNLEDRIKNYLKENASNLQGKHLKMTHLFLANEMGTTRVVTSRILKKLEKRNLIALNRAGIKIINLLGLTVHCLISD
jgi:CRP/FNR family transcriptional regulator